MYSDVQLKQALAKMLPEKVHLCDDGCCLYENGDKGRLVLDTELLHLCWLVEETLIQDQQDEYWSELAHELHQPKMIHATWQQRTIALCKVKGMEIV